MMSLGFGVKSSSWVSLGMGMLRVSLGLGSSS
jgi:hypothetical protein